jgi:hypothetical protein
VLREGDVVEGAPPPRLHELQRFGTRAAENAPDGQRDNQAGPVAPADLPACLGSVDE